MTFCSIITFGCSLWNCDVWNIYEDGKELEFRYELWCSPFLAVCLPLDKRTGNKKMPLLWSVIRLKSLVLNLQVILTLIRWRKQVKHYIGKETIAHIVILVIIDQFTYFHFFPGNLLLYKFFLTDCIILSRINELVWC